MTADERREAARLLAAGRERVTKTCEQCGVEFTGYAGQGVYCSSRCRNLAWRRAKGIQPRRKRGQQDGG